MAADQVRRLHGSLPARLENARRRFGRPLTLSVIHKAGGKTAAIVCRHTLTDEQVGWFRAGSALNALK